MQFEITREYIDQLKSLIDEKNTKEVEHLMEELHPADIAEIMEDLSTEDAKFIFLLLDGEQASDVLVEIPENDRRRFLKELPPEILLVRLPGHTRGHCGVAVQTQNGWLLHAGDTYYFHKQMHENSKTTLMVSLFQRLAHMDHEKAMQTKDRLREVVLQHKEKITVMCSHDTLEFESLSETQVK